MIYYQDMTRQRILCKIDENDEKICFFSKPIKKDGTICITLKKLRWRGRFLC